MSRRARILAAVALLVAAGSAACGLPRDGSPRAISPDAVPFALLASSTTAPPTEPEGTVSRTLYFVRADRLVTVNEDLPRGSASEVVQALLAGPSANAPTDVTTAIPRETRLVNIVLGEDNTLIIDLSNDILRVGGAEQKKAFAQLVYTAYRLPGVSGVRFRVDGADVAVTTDTGSVNGPLVPANFASLEPAPG